MGDAAETKETKRTFIVPTIKSFDNYDFGRAKTSCSLTWLVAKAFGSDSVPEELQEPFYRDQYEQEHLKPPVAALLLSAELYCRAGSLILRSDAVKPLLGHNAVIQALAQKGLYVTDQERLVTERDLCKTPIHMNSHLAMIDTLMMAYTVEMVSVERMLTCVQKYCPFLPEEDFPYDAEEAIITWINKVNEHLRDILTQQQSAKDPPGQETAAGHRARYKREDAKVRPAHCLPLLDNLLKDNTDGCALASLLHFYCPGSIPLEDVCLKETMSLADSLYNLQLVQAFCKDNLNGCCHFSLEDMLYASPSIKSNYLVFLAELFWWFEVVKPSFVQPRTFDTKEPVQSSAKMSPISKHNLVERPASPEQPRPKPSAISDAAVIKRSSSLSYVDGCVGTWPKEKRSSAHGISFEIPFDDVAQGQGQGRGMARSVSTEGFGFKVHHSSRGMGRNLSFQPINGQGAGIQEEATDSSSRPGRPRPRNDTRYSNGVLPGDPTPQPTTPTMEEALKIIHDCERPHGSLQPVSGGNGFFLHGPDGPGLPAEPDSPPTKAQYDGGDADLNSTSTDMDTGIHVRTEDIQDGVDEDSSLKDYSDMDQDCEARSCPLPERERGSPGASLLSSRSLGGSAASSLGSAAIRMTSFAEQKFRKLHHTDGQSESGGTTPEPPLPSVPSASAAIATQRAVTPDDRTITRRTPPRDHTHLLASEMVQLKMKLEEKRRAIEAQKKKVEAAFTRHRQRMGRTAFLNVVRRKGGSSSSPQEAESGSLDGGEKTPSASKVSNSEADSWLERCKPDGAPPKSPVEDGGGVGGVGEVDLTDYTRSIERLNTSLGFLQTEMQRLAQQQEVIMQMRESTAWVIPPPPQQPSPRKQLRELRSSSVAGRGSVGSLSPILSSTGSPRAPHRSPAPIKRKSASFHVRTPRTPRPSELKVTPISRMLNTPQSVDSLPRLRRFSPSQTQTTSFAYLGHDPRPTKGEPDSKEKPQAEVPGEGLVSDTNPDARALNPPSPGKVEKTKQEEKKEEERRAEGRAVRKPSVDELEWPASGKPSQPATGNVAAKQSQSQDAKDLIEVPLSVLNDPGLTSGWDGLPAGAAHDPDQKMCCGFFYRDDLQGEEDIAQKRAALLEKRMRREKEMQQKKQQQEVEQEQKKEVARLKAEEERLKKEEEKARREYIKNEHLRKKQLKLMDDMDSVIRPRTPSVKQKKPRPKSMHRDSMESPKPPAKAATGSRPRGFSVSSLSLASLNLADNESVQSDKRTPRPDSAEGYLSPCPSVPSRNGENWENESTTSSAASNTEYTGPKLYREPSAKSNKYIIQNALAHCCLAGKVNEGQKNKILEIMEKTEPNNFLILFRDSGCQFRSLYTYCPETQEICKLTGIGPKTITPKMIEGLFKYNSDKKQFSHIPAKTMSASVDAITIYGHLWHTKKQSTPKKLLK